MLRNVLGPLICLVLAAPAASARTGPRKCSARRRTTLAPWPAERRRSSASRSRIFMKKMRISAKWHSSCGCTTAQVSKSDLKTFESGRSRRRFQHPRLPRSQVGHASPSISTSRSRPKCSFKWPANIQGDVLLAAGRPRPGHDRRRQGRRTQAQGDALGWDGLEDRRREDARSALRSRNRRDAPRGRQNGLRAAGPADQGRPGRVHQGSNDPGHQRSPRRSCRSICKDA